MNKFYFIGGPKKGQENEFFKRLNDLGGAPPDWRIFPHSNHDGKALHIIEAKSNDEIIDHLKHFEDIYERTEIIEIVEIKK